MSRLDLYAAVKRLCVPAGRSLTDDRSDQELLQRFASERDEAAFAAIVRRHGRLVLATCRRVLHHDADAEDAFQATFLVLARKPAAVRSGQSAGPWLYAVALRLASRFRANIRRRRERERAAAGRPTPPATDPTLREVQAALDEELATLPERLRSPLVLCYLQARTQDEAAREMGWSVRTLRRRLEDGRLRLHARLVRRGFSLPAALVAAGLVHLELTAAVPARVAATARAAAAFAAGREAGASARAFALARTSLGGAFVGGWAATVALTMALGTVAGAGSFAMHRPADPEDRAVEVGAEEGAGAGNPAAAAARDAFGDPLPERVVARLGTIRFNHGRGLAAMHFSPDGKTILSRGGGVVRGWNAATGEERFHIRGSTELWMNGEATFSADGKQFITLQQGQQSDTLQFLDLAAQKEVNHLSLPVVRKDFSAYRRNAVSPDGRRFLLYSRADVRVFDTATAAQLCKLPKDGEDVQAVTFAGSDRVVTSDKGNNIDIWDAATGKSVRSFAAGTAVGAIVASADGRWLVTVGHHIDPVDSDPQDDVALLWDVATGQKKGSLSAGPKRRFAQIQLSPDGRHVHAATRDSAGTRWQVWETENPARERTFNTRGFEHLAISADGNSLVEGSDDGKFEVWDLRSGRRVSCGDGLEARVRAVLVVGDRVVTAGECSAAVWSATTGRRQRGFGLPGLADWVPTRCLSPDGRSVLTYEGDFEKYRAVVLDVATGRRMYASDSEAPSAFSSDFVASWHPDPASQGGFIRLREARTGKEVRTFPAKKMQPPWDLSFTADGKTLVVIGRQISACEVATGKELFSWRLPPPADGGGLRIVAAPGAAPEAPEDRSWWRSQAVSPSGTHMAFVLGGGESPGPPLPDRLVLTDASNGRVLRRWSDSGVATGQGEQLAFSPDGRQLASSDDTVVHLWEIATGKEIRTLRGHRGEIAALAFSADGRRLASAGHESITLLWDLTAGPRRADTTDREVAAWWADLVGDDAARADEAAWRLADAPVPAVTFLRQQLRAVTAADINAARARVTELDNESFAVREKATAHIERLGLSAVPVLERSLGDGPSAETRRRITHMLERLRPFPSAGEGLRVWRALTVLEHAGTPEAKRLLESLAGGEPEAWLTRESKAVLWRIGQVARPTP
jgi:RNA polymerase sigma factor (sigma-70 family)